MLHTEAGTEAGTVSHFANPAAQVSSHFGVALDGHGDQFLDLGDRSWANGILEPGNTWLARVYQGPRGGGVENPNHWTVTCETEDLGRAAGVTDAQYRTVLAAALMAAARYPSIRWLLRHTDISPSSRARCPGDRWLASGRFHQLAAAMRWATTV